MTEARATPDWERMLASMRAFFPFVGEGSPGFRCLHLDGVLASVTPAVPEKSVPNSVVYESEDALEAALGELEATYEEAGVHAWTVWVPDHHERAKGFLAQARHVLDATPTAMIAGLSEVEAPRHGDPEVDARPTGADIGAINDLAYGSEDSFTRMLAQVPPARAHNYVAHLDGRPAASVVAYDHDGDCGIYWVATIPAARGRGLAPGLMRTALDAVRRRGCTTTTLQATKVGRPVYERLGYRGFGTIEMWERRSPA
jgi:GNAT superfamily N-acetyltransferase